MEQFREIPKNIANQQHNISRLHGFRWRGTYYENGVANPGKLRKEAVEKGKQFRGTLVFKQKRS